MEDKKIKNRRNVIPPAASFSSPEAAGWLFKLIHEGWLRKRWRKRYCVLSNGILYFYELKTSDGTEKTCSSLNLKLYSECKKAPRKECKKSPNTILLEPNAKNEAATETAKNAKLVPKEFFYTETPEEQEKWVAKLQETLSFTCIGGNSKLNHITKTRARPPRGGGNRRPPTKQHIKERAMMPEVSLDADLPLGSIENGSSKKRGHIPVSALRPPPGGLGKLPLKPKPSLERNTENKKSQEEEVAEESEPLSPPLKSPLVLTPKSPTPPPAAMKPASTKRVAAVRSDSSGSADSKKSLSSGSPRALPGLLKDENGKLSLPSSRASSIRSNQSSPKQSKEVSISSQPATPPLSDSPTKSIEPMTNDSASQNNSPEIKNNDGFEIDLNLLTSKIQVGERMMKAKSMVDLDRDSEDEELLPPPPTPPSSPSQKGSPAKNGDVTKKKKEKEKKKQGKKKKGKKNRPSSLVIDI